MNRFLSHRVAADSSPRCKPWGHVAQGGKPGWGGRNSRSGPKLFRRFAARGYGVCFSPTAHAVAWWKRRRSIFPPRQATPNLAGSRQINKGGLEDDQMPGAGTSLHARDGNVSTLEQQFVHALAISTKETQTQNHHRFFQRHERRTSSLCHSMPSRPPTKLPNRFVNSPCLRWGRSGTQLKIWTLFLSFWRPKVARELLRFVLDSTTTHSCSRL